MIKGLFGSQTVSAALRGGLNELSATQRTIADRVANATARSSAAPFGTTLEQAMADREADLQRDMASLADTQLRYEAVARLLQGSYRDLHTAVRSNG